jgi:hypothetical protein
MHLRAGSGTINCSEEFTTIGTSMLPSMLPGSELNVELALKRLIRTGDVVCFLGSRGELFAHRVVVTAGTDVPQVLQVKGDAQACIEVVPSSAVAYVVTRVEHPLLSYDTASPLGRFFAWSAIEHPTVTRAAATLMRQAARVRSALRALASS